MGPDQGTRFVGMILCVRLSILREDTIWKWFVFRIERNEILELH